VLQQQAARAALFLHREECRFAQQRIMVNRRRRRGLRRRGFPSCFG
jgi:hypothetical protein